MRKYHVYGLGHALVDMEYQVSDQFLSRMKIEKGLMTLVEEEQLTRLLKALTGHRCKRVSGGSGANSIYAVSQMGGNAYYSCKVADDDQGDFYVHDLTEASVDTNLHDIRESGVTGISLVMVTPDAERTMNTHLGITSNLSMADVRVDAIKDSEYIYIEGYLATAPNTRDAACYTKEIAEANSIKTALSFSDPSMVKYFKSDLMHMLGSGVDLLFCNKEEALLWTDSHDLNSSIESLKKFAKTFVITIGMQGSLIYDGHEIIEVPTMEVKAVDTTGAGDMYAGAFLYAITHGYDYKQAGQLANFAASNVVTVMGARMQAADYQNFVKHGLF